MRRALESLAIALVLAAAANARADTFALDRYEPTPAGDVFHAAPTPLVATLSDAPGAPRAIDVRASVIAEYASKPLVIRNTISNPGIDAGSIVSQQTFVHAAVAIAFGARFLASIDVPVLVATGGDSPSTER
jgi:hypothetical protein